MIQIISVIITGLLLAVVFMRNKENLSLKKMTLTAIMLGIALVLTMFAFSVFFLGGQVVVRFSQICIMLIGATMGPIYGVIGGLAFDIINLLINPQGSFYIGFTLNNILVGLLPALVFKYLRKVNAKVNLGILVATLTGYLIYIVTVVGIIFNYSKINDAISTVISLNSLFVISFIIVAFILLMIYLSKRGIKVNNDFIMLLIAVTFVEFIVQGFLTPLWLSDMAGTPIILSMQIRALKGVVMIAINMFVGYPVLKIIKQRVL